MYIIKDPKSDNYFVSDDRDIVMKAARGEIRNNLDKITFSKEQKLENKKKKRSFWQTTKSTTFREYLSIPFIYSMMIPAVILDLFLFMYQQTAMRLYRIPLVKRSDYITLERKHLDYLNWVEKLNCIYCSYVNWLFAYAVEIAWRTEKYWCPIKHAKKMTSSHNWEKYFADYGDADWFKEVFRKNQEFYQDEKETK